MKSLIFIASRPLQNQNHLRPDIWFSGGHYSANFISFGGGGLQLLFKCRNAACGQQLVLIFRRAAFRLLTRQKGRLIKDSEGFEKTFEPKTLTGKVTQFLLKRRNLSGRDGAEFRGVGL